ncbi:uncharacterized protein LOC136027323 [Artemia franciscana]|uniref:MADF domain-containing protein n=1 Tax=Artemia franciscana TaxID=6661 RepID=A0AA88KYV4_ARTSF|nr:hypothetical protein QYM36_013513 [Artemia franciscana]
MNKDYVSALISAIKARPELYDSASPRYKCRVGRHLLWNEVAEESGLTVEECRKTWKNMRDYFYALRRRNYEKNSDWTKRIKWEYWDKLQFLATTCAVANLELSMDDPEVETNLNFEEMGPSDIKKERNDMWYCSYTSSPYNNVECVRSPETKRAQNGETTSAETAANVSRTSALRTYHVSDDNELFLLSLGTYMKRLNDRDNMLFRCKVQELILQFLKEKHEIGTNTYA